MIFKALNDYLADFTKVNEDFQYVHITIKTKYEEFARSLFLPHIKVDVVYDPHSRTLNDSIFSVSQIEIKAKFKGVRAYNLSNYMDSDCPNRDYIHQETLIKLGTLFMPRLFSSMLPKFQIQSDSKFLYSTNGLYPKNALQVFFLTDFNDLKPISFNNVYSNDILESAKYKFHSTVSRNIIRFTNSSGASTTMLQHYRERFIHAAILHDLYEVRLHPMEVKEYDHSVEPTKVYTKDDKGFNHLNIPNIAEGFYYRSRTYLDLSDFETDYVGRCVVTNRMLIYGIGSTHDSFPSLGQTMPYVLLNAFEEVCGANQSESHISGYVNTVLKIAELKCRLGCSQCGDDINNGYYSGLMYDELVNAGETQIADFFKEMFLKVRSDFINDQGSDNLCYSCKADQDKYGEFLANGSFVRDFNGFYYINPAEGIKEPPYDGYLFGLQDWSFKPTNYNFVTTSDDFSENQSLFMGVELEFDDGGENKKSAAIALGYLTKNKPHAYAMHDGSLDNGIEIATMPATLNAHMDSRKFDYEAMSKVLKTMDYTAQSNDRCGMHVHVNRDFFGEGSKKQMLSAALMALIIESNWEDIVKFSRRDYYSIDRWAGKKQLKERKSYNEESVVDDFIDEYDDRYVALNINPSKTFEFRIFNSSLKRNVILATLQFVSNLAHMVKGMSLNQAQHVTFGDVVSYHYYDELNDLCLKYNLPTE